METNINHKTINHNTMFWPFKIRRRQRNIGNIMTLTGIALLMTTPQIPYLSNYIHSGYIGLILAIIGMFYFTEALYDH